MKLSMFSSPAEDVLKREAKKLKNNSSKLSLMQAQNAIAKIYGFSDWYNFKQNVKKGETNHIDKFKTVINYSTPDKEPLETIINQYYSNMSCCNFNMQDKEDEIIQASPACYLGYHEATNLNIYVPLNVFYKHSLLISDNDDFHYLRINYLMPKSRSFIYIGNGFNFNILHNTSLRDYHSMTFSLNDTGIKSLEVSQQELCEILKSVFSHLDPAIESKIMNIVSPIIYNIPLNDKGCLLFNKELLIYLKSELISKSNMVSNNYIYYFDILIQSCLFSDNGLEIDCLNAHSYKYFLETPSYENNLLYISFSLLINFAMSKLIQNRVHLNKPVIPFSVFYTNPFFGDLPSIIYSMARGFGISLNYCITFDSEIIHHKKILTDILSNCSTFIIDKGLTRNILFKNIINYDIPYYFKLNFNDNQRTIFIN